MNQHMSLCTRVKDTNRLRNYLLHVTDYKKMDPANNGEKQTFGKKGKKFLIVKNEEKASAQKRVVVSRKMSDSVMYLIKATHADAMMYEFTTKGHNVDEIVALVHNIKCRRNAFCENNSSTIVDALEEYLGEKVIEEEW